MSRTFVGLAVAVAAACGGGSGESPPTEVLIPDSGIQRRTIEVTTTGSAKGAVTSWPAGISCPGQCSAVFPGRERVVLSASAAAGTIFIGWSGACSEVAMPSTPGNSLGDCVVAETAEAAVRARFADQ